MCGSGDERESACRLLFALFVMHECETQKKKGPLDHISLEHTEGSFLFLLHVCTDCYYCERKRRTNAKLFCVLAKPPTRTKERGA